MRFFSGSGSIALRNVAYVVFAKPVSGHLGLVPQLQVIDTEIDRQFSCGFNDLVERVRVARYRSAVDQERDRNQGIAEQQALDVHERQHGFDLAIVFAVQVVGRMMQAVLDQ